MEELEAEAVLLGRPLDELAAVQEDRAHPLAHLGRLVDEQGARLQHAPQFGPALQGPSDLRGGALASVLGGPRPRGHPDSLGKGQSRAGPWAGQRALLVFKRSV